MNQPPQGGPGNPPPNQGPYQSPSQGQYGAQPQQPGQYNAAPQHPGQYGHPPQGQYAAQYPQHPPGQPYPPRKTGPSVGLGILKVLVGLCLSLGLFGGLMHAGHEGIAAGAIMGTILGIGLRWMVTGGANAVGKKIPLLPSLAIVLVGTLIGAFAGPPLSEAHWKSEEESTFDELAVVDVEWTDGWMWDYEYFDKIPPKFYRDEARGAKKLAEVRESIRLDNLVEVREHVYDIAVNHKDDPNYQEAFDLASGELQKRYDAVLEKLGKPGGETTGDAEFAVDEDLRAAFKTILTDLAKAPTPDVYLAFANQSKLEAPVGHEKGLADEVRWVKSQGMTVMDPPLVIDPGNAFSSSYDAARRNSFMQVSGDAFEEVFDANLFVLKPLASSGDREGKFVFEVSSTIRRTDTYFHYTSSQADGSSILNGFLFAIEVDWELKLFNRKGELMYERKVKSAPGSSLSIIPQSSDPDWAVYSILMDSAYYNYSREVVGNFGLNPPVEKSAFSYSDYGISGG